MKTIDEKIDDIELLRKNNNINWCDLIRLAFRVAPDEAKEIMKKICAADRLITDAARGLADE